MQTLKRLWRKLKANWRDIVKAIVLTVSAMLAPGLILLLCALIWGLPTW